MYKRILVPLDGSRLAEAPLDYAASLAQKSDAELILVHVFRGRLSRKSHYLQRTAETISYGTHKHQNGQLPIRIRTESLSGDPATQILKYVDDSKVDLVAMSTHGHSGIRHWLLGSVADRIVHYSNRPVWLIKSFDNEVTGIPEYDRKILVLLDGSELAEKILPYTAFHASLSEGELILLNVCEPPEIIPSTIYHLVPHGYPPRLPLQWENYVKQETEGREKECRLYLEQRMAEYGKDKFKVRYELRSGEAATEITRYLESNLVSLVALTTRGRSGLSRRVFGSVAEKVLAASKSPLLILRPGEEHRKE